MPPSPDRLQEAESLLARGEAARARDLLRRVIDKEPRHVAALLLMTRALGLLGENEAALFYAGRAYGAAPDDPLLIALYGRALGAAQRLDEAIPVLRRGVAAAPQMPAAWVSLALALYQKHALREVVAACEGAWDAGIQNPELDELLGGALLGLGDAGAATAALERGAARWPGNPLVLSHLCCAMNYDPGAEPLHVRRRHLEYGALLARDLPALPPVPPERLDPAKQLTLGLVSSDLRAHSIAWFVEPLLEKLDRSRFRVACYHAGLVADEVSTRLRGLSDLWRHVPRLGPGALASQIREDGVDIAIDLSGHTDGHRLAALHMRPAPLQATWLGYPNTTGVGAIDLRLVDSLTDPAGAEAHASERLVRLDPCFLCYRPPGGEGAPAPAMPEGGVIFGSFSANTKVNDRVAALWARLLNAVPGSRLLLKNEGLSAESVREAVRARFARAGLEPGRLELVGWASSTREHLALYGRAHLALDTFPYHGTTTTCEALFMGTPVVTLAGNTHASRVGVSLLSAVEGGRELVARGEDEYLAIAAALAGDRGRLASYRRSLRGRLLASPLCDEGAFAARFGEALRGAWRERCRG